MDKNMRPKGKFLVKDKNLDLSPRRLALAPIFFISALYCLWCNSLKLEHRK